jgi:hypothetical protein
MAFFVALLGIALPSTGWACGYWFLQDDETNTEVTFLATSMELLPRGAPPNARKQELGWFGYESPAFCQRVRSNKLDVRDGQFLRGKKVVGRLEGNTVEVGDRKFDITVQPLLDRKGRQDLISHLPYWNVEVRSGGKPVAHGPAISFVMCSHADSTEKEKEIRERVACYLVLSRGGRMPPPAIPPSKDTRGGRRSPTARPSLRSNR